MALSLDQFGKALVTAGFFSADELKALWQSLPSASRPKGADEWARSLVERGRLTSFQADEFLAGRGAELVLGDYVLLDRIGAGGMGQVFKAQHRRMDRTVALKLIAPKAVEDEAAVKRFQREVKAAARLTHPNIVAALDAREERGRHYLVMEFVDGGDLSTVVRKHGPLPIEQAIECVLQAARGLEYAHSKGVVHRDIKPANLLLDAGGTVKILDMGLARFDGGVGGEDDGLTGTGNIMGTVDYMSPEQALDTKHADARADIYSLGCTLYSIAAGRKPFDGDTVMKKLMAHRDAPIPSLAAARADAPPKLDAVLAKMLAKKPEERYQSMAEVCRALEACLLHTAVDLEETTQFSASSSNSSSSSGKLRLFLDGLRSSTAAPPRPVTASDMETFAGEGESVPAVAPPPPSTAAAGTGARATTTRRPAVRRPAVLVLCALGTVSAVVGLGILAFNRGRPEPSGGPNLAGPTAAIGSSQVSVSRGEKPGPMIERAAPEPAVAPFDAARARAYQEAWAARLNTKIELPNSLGVSMVLLPPGKFTMGTTAAELEELLAAVPERNKPGIMELYEADQRPPHEVTLTNPFRLAANEVTVAQFRRFVEAERFKTAAERNSTGGFAYDEQTKKTYAKSELIWSSPGFTQADDHPVVQIAWEDAVEFCNWLSGEEGLSPAYVQSTTGSWVAVENADGYRLPTEAEWEFACRAGTTGAFLCGSEKDLQSHAWIMVYGEKLSSHPVGGKLPNAFGLRDMQGNASEWVQDWYAPDYYANSPSLDPPGPPSGSRRMIRGASFFNPLTHCASGHRRMPFIQFPSFFSGFRVAKSVPVSPAVVGAASMVPASHMRLPPAMDSHRTAAETVIRVGGKVSTR
jgi:serine/threonine-protein kinase